ncbi:lipocalin family protein [Alphaproteobacteria bacterium KMM 3653]|uniref:Lipocalin family protein n=1 Tax=Harenicola maris TaxID=2841044 RepID=A0AAP2CSJ4_9RHOB|nr:lipocalin family protein [Harenicola maris]
MRRIGAWLGLCLGLSACLPAQDGPAPPAQGFRTAQGEITSIALFSPARASGDWVELARFAAPGEAGCRFCRFSLSAQRGGLVLQPKGGSLSLLRPSGPGRMLPKGQANGDEWWVLWVDADYRTMVVGTPSGSMGYVFNRPGGISADRRKIARDVLGWAGYDGARLLWHDG